jgi:hypothetical protein
MHYLYQISEDKMCVWFDLWSTRYFDLYKGDIIMLTDISERDKYDQVLHKIITNDGPFWIYGFYDWVAAGSISLIE